jgi:GLPGLI family protein
MKNKLTFLLAFALLILYKTNAQQLFLEKVNIEFAKTVSVWPLMKEADPQWFDRVKSIYPQETISYFGFQSDGNKSLYKRTKEADIPRSSGFQPFADENIIYNDYTNSTTISQKPLYDETFLLQDSLLNIKWQITADTRIIAGFECRKAVGILYDTIAVFAFYTDEIKVNGGPEGIAGLPGMILGVGVPRLHTTWFATKVNIASDAELRSVTPATKGSKTVRSKMVASLDNLTKRSVYGRKLLLAYML